MLLTEKQLIAHTQLSRPTLWELRKKGLPHYRAGRSIRYRLDEVEAWLRENQQAAPPASTGEAADAD